MPRRRTTFTFNGLAIGDAVSVCKTIVGTVTGVRQTDDEGKEVRVVFNIENMILDDWFHFSVVRRLDARTKAAREAR